MPHIYFTPLTEFWKGFLYGVSGTIIVVPFLLFIVYIIIYNRRD